MSLQGPGLPVHLFQKYDKSTRATLQYVRGRASFSSFGDFAIVYSKK